MTSPRRHLHAPMFVMIVLALSVAVTGCATAPDSTASSSAPADSASATAVSILTVTGTPLSGTGATGWPGLAMPIPTGIQSVSIDFSCDGTGHYTVEFGDSMADNTATISGSCGTKKPLDWPVDAKTSPTLAVTVDDGIPWKAIPHFSSAAFERDAAVSAECAAFTDIYSALINADEGYTQYKAFDAAEWSRRVAAASSRLNDLAIASTSALKAPLTAMSTIVAGATAPGTAQAGIADAVAQVGAACDANQTPFVITAEFGG